MNTLVLPTIALTSLCTAVWLLNDASPDEVASLDVVEQTRKVDSPTGRPQIALPQVSVGPTPHAAGGDETALSEGESLAGPSRSIDVTITQHQMSSDYDAMTKPEPKHKRATGFDMPGCGSFELRAHALYGTVERLDQVFSCEPYEPVWAGATESALAHSFAEARLEGSELTGARCRTTLCRVEVVHADELAEGRFLAAFASSGEYVSSHAKGFYANSVDYTGMPRTVFFWARAGDELPPIDSN